MIARRHLRSLLPGIAPLVRRSGLLAVSIALAAGCTIGATGGTASPGGSAGAPPVLGTAELKLRLVDRLGPRWYCDPDEYPVARGDELTAMRERWPEVTRDASTLGAILAHDRLPSDPASLTDDQRLVAYRLWKVLRSIALDPSGGDRYAFDYLARPATGATDGTRTRGTIDAHGAIAIADQAAAPAPMCPICLARGTRIDAPGGSSAVEGLAIGDRVWTLDLAGRRTPGVVLALGSVPAPPGHRVVHLTLADGRSVAVSPGHPLADGRRVGDLRVGDPVDGSTVVEATSVPYDADRTFDLVVSGPTGIYLADGIPLASTIR